MSDHLITRVMDHFSGHDAILERQIRDDSDFAEVICSELGHFFQFDGCSICEFEAPVRSFS